MLAGEVTKATVKTLLSANKSLRMAKTNADVGLEYRYLGDRDDLTMVAYSDASFACRSVNSRCWFCTGETTECGEKDFFFQLEEKIRVIPTGVEPLTFWLLQWNLGITKC